MDKIKELMQKPSLSGLMQFIKFGIVGISNTLISYGVELLCYYVVFSSITFSQTAKIWLTTVVAFIISVTNSYYWNNRFVFKTDLRLSVKEHMWRYLRTVVCYGVTGMIFAPLLKMWIASVNVPYWLVSMGTLIITIPLNFILNKFWAFKEKIGKDEDTI